jgi:predicted small lipoprotein YifL
VRDRRTTGALCAILVLCTCAACGQKGPPLPPLRPVPVAVSDLAAVRRDDRVTLSLTIPGANFDGSTPPAIDRVEIYGTTTPAAAPPTTRQQLLDQKYVLTTIAVRPASAAPTAKPDAKPDTKPDTRPAPGTAVTFVDTVKVDPAAGDLTRYYTAVGFAGRRRGATMGVVSVPLTKYPAAPTALAFNHDEKTVKFTWQGAAAGDRFNVYEVPPGAADKAEAKLVVPSPLSAAEVSLPIEFGRERCVVVRGVHVNGPAVVEGPPSEPRCGTPVDKFPPPAPTRFVAVAVEGGIELVWSGVDAPDLAGYRVMRRESTVAIFQPLVGDKLVAETTYKDATVKSGVTYVYSVIAVDKAGNLSEQSNWQELTARIFDVRFAIFDEEPSDAALISD